MCHAQETERQELKGQSPQHLESQLNPDMMELFDQNTAAKTALLGGYCGQSARIGTRRPDANSLHGRQGLPQERAVDTQIPARRLPIGRANVGF